MNGDATVFGERRRRGGVARVTGSNSALRKWVVVGPLLPAGRGYAAGVHYLHACPPHAFFARERLLRAAARLGRGRRRGLEAACALRGDYDSGFCALSAVLRVCDGAGAKAAAPMARAAIIAVFIV